MKGDWRSRMAKSRTFFLRIFSDNQIGTNLMQALPFWVASLLTGLTAVLYTRCFIFTEDFLFSVLRSHQWAIFIFAPVCFLLAWLCIQWLAPNAKGSGIPQVMASIELASPKQEEKLPRLLSLRIIFTKIVSSLLMVLGGGAIGREGPTIQVAGSVFYVIHRWIPKSWPRLSHQSFILTGAAAGLAAAFNTPLGGIVFAVEELARIHIRYFRTALFSAVIIAGLTAQAFLGPYLYLGYPEVRNLPFHIFVAVALTAVVAGLLGSGMSWMILKIMQWKKSFNKVKTVLFIMVSALVVATLATLLNNEIVGSGKKLMNLVLFTNEKYSSWHMALMRITGTVLAFNIGAAGGVFAPSLAAGAAVGSYLSSVLHMSGGSANIIILTGMVGFLTGVTRTPFTSAILVLEMTDRHSVIFHLMLAALLSNVAALLIDKHSLYDRLKKDFLDEPPAQEPPPNAVAQ